MPKQNAKEAAIVDGLNVYGVEHLDEVVDFLSGNIILEQTIVKPELDFSLP